MTSWRTAGPRSRKIHGNALTEFDKAVLEDQAAQNIIATVERARDFRCSVIVRALRVLITLSGGAS